jgi:hypothetical protein
MNDLETGRECYRRLAWGHAYHALLAADKATPLGVDDLDRLSTAAYLTGRDLEFQHILERLYRVHIESGDRPRAARSTFWLALTCLLRGESGQSNAWIARGQRLVEDGDCVERAYLAVIVAEQQLGDGQADAAYATAVQAAAVGESCRDADLTAAGRHAQGRALIQRSDVVAGLKCLDETMLAVVAGELSPIMTGLMYCSVIDTCRQVYALGRAREWTAAFSSVCAHQPEMVAFTGACLVHRVEILQLQGHGRRRWPKPVVRVNVGGGPSASRRVPRSINRARSIACAASLRRPRTPIVPRASWGSSPNPDSRCSAWPRDAPTLRAQPSAG